MKRKPKVPKKLLREVMSWVGSHKSEKKAAASRENGKLGGRPRSKNGKGN